MRPVGVVAAGHQTSAEAGAAVLRDGGNAVDAALGALLASFTCEPMLTGLGAGGYMLVVPPGQDPVVLDFFVDAPGRRGTGEGEMVAVEVSFGDAIQVFNGGVASAGVYGTPAGIVAVHERFATKPLSELVRPAAQLARTGVPLAPKQAYILEIVHGLAMLTPEARELYAPTGTLLRAGEAFRDPALADALELLGDQGAEPFYRGAVAAAVAEWVGSRGGSLGREDLAEYTVDVHKPVAVSFRGAEVLTNPPSSAGGVLLARTLHALDRTQPPVPASALVAAMAEAQELRTSAFLEDLAQPGFVERFLGDDGGSRLGSTTHVAALDVDGLACSMTTSNGSSSGVVVPGTGIHLNNMLGEQDLNPLGFHRHLPGRRLPSMMAPTAVIRDGRPELVLGSAGSNRIRSAILQTILRALDDRMPVEAAVIAPRLHYEAGTVFAEPGVDLQDLESDAPISRFRDLNLFFGGVQAVSQTVDGRLSGAGDPRRGGAAVVAFA